VSRHRVTFLPLGVTVTVDEERYPLADHGKPGSLLDIALANDIPLEHNCGGSCACTTCHVVVKEGEENLSEMDADEEDRLDMAEGLTIHSRLGCQAVVRGDVVVAIPS
jgi:2Fe-2S ferredoxin